MSKPFVLQRSAHTNNKWWDKFSRTIGHQGISMQDIDMVIHNYLTNDIVLLEVKSHGALPNESQVLAYQRIDKIMRRGSKETRPPWKYHGVWLLVIEGTSPDDGRLWLNGVVVTPDQLRAALVNFKNPQRGWAIEKCHALCQYIPPPTCRDSET